MSVAVETHSVVFMLSVSILMVGMSAPVRMGMKDILQTLHAACPVTVETIVTVSGLVG